MKRRCDEDEESVNFEQYGERIIKRLMKEADSQANVDLSKAGRKFQDVDEIRMTGDRSELEIEFQRLKIDKHERVLSSPISPRTAAALEGMTTLMGNWSTMSEGAFRSHLERGEDGERGLSSTLKRTMLLELSNKKEQEGEKGEREETNENDDEGTAEEILEDEEEEEEREQSDAATLPTIEISDSTSSDEEDEIEVLRITGLTDSEADSEDGKEVKDIVRLEFNADPMGEVNDPGLISTLDLGPTEIAGQRQHSVQRKISFQQFDDLEEVLEGEVKRSFTSGKTREQKTREEEGSSLGGRGRSRNKTNRDAERRAIREMTRQDLAEKRKKDRREKESTRRTPIEPVIASPHLKRPRDGEGDWVRAEAHHGEAGATRASCRARERPGNPIRSETPSMRSLPRLNQWNEDNVLPTLDMFTRSISAGPSVTELFPGLSAFRVKPNMLARYYVDDGRMLERREAIKKIMDEQDEYRTEGEETKEFGGGNTENQRKPRTSGSSSGLGTPRRRNRIRGAKNGGTGEPGSQKVIWPAESFVGKRQFFKNIYATLTSESFCRKP